MKTMIKSLGLGLMALSSVSTFSGQGANGPDHQGEAIPLETGREVYVKDLDRAFLSCYEENVLADVVKLLAKGEKSIECSNHVSRGDNSDYDFKQEVSILPSCSASITQTKEDADENDHYYLYSITMGTKNYGDGTVKFIEVKKSTCYKADGGCSNFFNDFKLQTPLVKTIHTLGKISFVENSEGSTDVFGQSTSDDSIASDIMYNRPKSDSLPFINLTTSKMTQFEFDFEKMETCLQRELVNAQN